jgi:hypothetical protein
MGQLAPTRRETPRLGFASDAQPITNREDPAALLFFLGSIACPTIGALPAC